MSEGAAGQRECAPRAPPRHPGLWSLVDAGRRPGPARSQSEEPPDAEAPEELEDDSEAELEEPDDAFEPFDPEDEDEAPLERESLR